MNYLRSVMNVPANQADLFHTAVTCGSDGIFVDLEDALPEAEKDISGDALTEIVDVLAARGAAILVRVNNSEPFLAPNLAACAQAEADSIVVPKVESAADLIFADRYLNHLERSHGLPPRSIELLPMIETAKGVMNAQEIVRASPRIRYVTLGGTDYYRDLGCVPSTDDFDAFRWAFSYVANIAIAHGVQPWGIVGRVADVQNSSGFERNAIKSRQLGSKGGPCIVPEQVAILNRVFWPSEQEITWAKEVIAAYEKAVREGIGTFAHERQFACYSDYQIAQDIVRKVTRQPQEDSTT